MLDFSQFWQILFRKIRTFRSNFTTFAHIQWMYSIRVSRFTYEMMACTYAKKLHQYKFSCVCTINIRLVQSKAEQNSNNNKANERERAHTENRNQFDKIVSFVL